jgi:hypothetical protein
MISPWNLTHYIFQFSTVPIAFWRSDGHYLPHFLHSTVSPGGMDLLSSEFMETTTNLSDLLNMNGNDLDNELFCSAEAGADNQHSVDFSNFDFMQPSPDSNHLHDLPLDPFDSLNDGECGAIESVESDKKIELTNHEHQDSTKAEDSKRPDGKSLALPRKNGIGESGDAVGLKFDSANPVLFHPSPEPYDDSIVHKLLSSPQDQAGNQLHQRRDPANLSSNDRLHAVVSQQNPPPRAGMHSPPMRRRGQLMEGLLQMAPSSAGRRRSQSMPPAEMSFIRRLENGDVMGIGQPVPSRQNTARLPPRHHPYANARKRQATDEIYMGGHSRGMSANRGMGQHVFRSTHRGGAMTLPNSPAEHMSGTSSFKYVGSGTSYFDGAIPSATTTDADHPMHRAAGGLAMEHQRIDPISAIQRFSRDMLVRLDRTINSMRKEVLMFAEDPELEM